MNEQTVSSRSEAGRVLTLSTIAFTLLFAVWLMLGVLAVPIKKELGLSAVQFTWLTAIAVLSGSLFRLPFGVLTDRVGGKRLMVALLLWTAVPCYFVSQVHSFQEIMVLAFLFGIAGNSFSVGIAWNAAWFPREQQGAALGTFGAGNVGASITKLFGPKLMLLVPLGGAFGGLLPGGWRAIPVIYSVLLVAMAAALMIWAPAKDHVPGKGRSLLAMTVPLREVRVWRFGLYYVVVFGAYVALSMWLPAYYTRVYEVPLTTAALLTAFFIFPASLLRPLGGFLSDKFGGRVVTYSVFVAMTITSLVLCLPSALLPLPAFFAATLLLGIGMGIGKASVYKYVPEYYPKDVGLVGGLVGTLGALGGFFLPLGFGYGEEFLGRPEVCFYLLTAVTLVSLAWLHVTIRSLQSAERSMSGLAAPAE
jgi:MFS transporter, NNP family, nitrate/nitrite transporter